MSSKTLPAACARGCVAAFQRDRIRALERTHARGVALSRMPTIISILLRFLERGKVQVGASASSFVTSAPPVNPETSKTDKV